jgi:tRNA threonylcarbamoyladenosine biosynthesis protein TsaE
MPILDKHTLDFISHSPEQTRRFGARLGALLHAGDVICLEGQLGTGKTCLTQGIGQGMGIVEPITTLYHIDLYRLAAPVDEALALGLADYLRGDGICVIEWAERIRSALPNQRLWIVLRYLDDSKRGILMKAAGKRYDQILQKFRRDAFGV